ncbi:hypothetical protein L1049_024905 [Liquidambar formosana]|uniref:Uncharacterized protein n=1 Tax=Liquidambar formosana TaxID=63359 RepID=A0AAP0S1D2_LIQFO
MSVLECPDIQIWNNAAFDNGESEDSGAIKSSWTHLQPIFVSLSESIESESSKENQSPVLGKSLVSVKSPIPIKALHPNGAIGNSQAKPTKLLSKQGLVVPPDVAANKGNVDEICGERNIDSEIVEIELEINRLSSRLEELRLEKAERNAKTTERRGRVVPAKFMEQKQSGKNLGAMKKIDEPLSLCGMTKVQRRGVSLGPAEIFAGGRFRQLGKPEITPVQPIQNRRKSCFWKLQDIDEGKVTKERGKSLSVSPKSRRTISKIQAPKQAMTTVGSKKPIKKEDGFISSIQPKKLFKDGEKSVPAKKPMKTGRVVASRYNQGTIQSTGNSAMRKRSLPENDKDDGKRYDKKRASVGKSGGILPESCPSQGMESRGKKRWETPSEVVFYKSMVDNSPPSISAMPDVLPKIRTTRCAIETPRDSGAAKRVAELIGRKSYFGDNEGVESSVCQALSFVEEEDVEEK